MNIYLSTGRVARLANNRILIVNDESASAPWHNQDMVFNPHASVVCDAPLYDIEGKEIIASKTVTDGHDVIDLHTTEERVKQLCGSLTPEGLERIWAYEKKQIEAWIHGENFAIICETWDPEERVFKTTEHIGGYIGVDEVLADLEERVIDPSTVICVEPNVAFWFDITKEEKTK